MNNTRGEIRIPAGVAVWPHELKTAQLLATAGYFVEFLQVDNSHDAKSPDIMLNGEKWEIKSPKTDKLSAVERNLKRASKQSPNIIIDSRRMKKIHDSSVQKFLIKKLAQQKSIKRLILVNRKHQVIDINKMI